MRSRPRSMTPRSSCSVPRANGFHCIDRFGVIARATTRVCRHANLPHGARTASVARRFNNSCSRLLPVRLRPARTRTCFVKTAEFLQQIAANARQQMIGFQRRLVREPVNDRKRGCRTLGHADRHRAVELDDRRAHQRRQFGVEFRRYAASRSRRTCLRWHDRRRSPPAAHRSRRRRRVRAPAPAPAFHAGSAAGPTARGSGPSAGWVRRHHRCARRGARGVQLHQRQQAMRLGFLGAIEVSTRPIRSASLQSCGRSHSSPRAAV